MPAGPAVRRCAKFIFFYFNDFNFIFNEVALEQERIYFVKNKIEIIKIKELNFALL